MLNEGETLTIATETLQMCPCADERLFLAHVLKFIVNLEILARKICPTSPWRSAHLPQLPHPSGVASNSECQGCRLNLTYNCLVPAAEPGARAIIAPVLLESLGSETRSLAHNADSIAAPSDVRHRTNASIAASANVSPTMPRTSSSSHGFITHTIPIYTP
jgi:hypothetical protein